MLGAPVKFCMLCCLSAQLMTCLLCEYVVKSARRGGSAASSAIRCRRTLRRTGGRRAHTLPLQSGSVSPRATCGAGGRSRYPMTRSEAPSASMNGPHWSHTDSEAAVTNSTYMTYDVSCCALMTPSSAMRPPISSVATCVVGKRQLVRRRPHQAASVLSGQADDKPQLVEHARPGDQRAWFGVSRTPDLSNQRSLYLQQRDASEQCSSASLPDVTAREQMSS